MSGFYLMQRGWMEHPVFGGDLSKAIRWAWLIDRACWRPTRTMIAGRMVELARGQLTASTRFLAKAWRCSEPDARRFLGRLKTDGMVDTSAEAGQLVITVNNYDKHQVGGAATGTAKDPRMTQGLHENRRSSDALTDACHDAASTGSTICNDEGFLDVSKLTDAPTDAPTDAKSTRQRRSSDANKKEGKEEVSKTLSEPDGSSRGARAVDAPGGVTAQNPDQRAPGDHLDDDAAPLAGPVEPQQPTLAGFDAPQVDLPSQPQAPRPARKTRWSGSVPQDWQDEAAVIFPGLNIGMIAVAFEDYWTDRTGAPGMKSNWRRTWSVWVARDAERQPSRGAQAHAAQPAQRTVIDAMRSFAGDSPEAQARRKQLEL